MQIAPPYLPITDELGFGEIEERILNLDKELSKRGHEFLVVAKNNPEVYGEFIRANVIGSEELLNKSNKLASFIVSFLKELSREISRIYCGELCTQPVLVEEREVKKNFLLAEIAKDKIKTSKNGLTEIYQEVSESILGLNENEVNECINKKSIWNKISSLNWYKGNISLSKVGAWPKMKGISKFLTKGNVIDTAKGIERVLKGGNGSFIPPEVIGDFDSIQRNIFFIRKKFYPILVPTGELIRDGQNKDGFYELFNYDIMDGNTRAVASALKGFENLPVYFGEYK
ncbi:hypothetical protein ES703_99680 [subsurface metagenome]